MPARPGGARAPPRRAAVAARASDLLAYGEEDDTSWLIPYVDVVSLLLAFLILALAMSKVNLRKFEMRLGGDLPPGAAALARRAQGEDRRGDRSARV